MKMNKCKQCVKIIRNPNFCNHSCSAIYNNKRRTYKIKEKIRNTLKGRELTKREYIKCRYCNKIIRVIPNNSNNRFCNRKCYNGYGNKNKKPYKIYQEKCKFKFSVYKFPKEFNLSLIIKHGWYTAKNRGNNINGIVRDHIVSIKYGFINKISYKIISHPSNCQLLTGRQNVRKSSKCFITFKELLKKIDNWNEKYKPL